MGVRLRFTPLREHEPGILLRLLDASYRELVDAFPEQWSGEARSWAGFDAAAFAKPDTVGACVFVTCHGNQPIGLGSFEPENALETGRVGHNCILPEFRGNGYGSRQLEEVVRRLRSLRCRRALATTSEHPFFMPARQMYLSQGFVEIGRREGGPDPAYRLVDLELSLVSPSSIGLGEPEEE